MISIWTVLALLPVAALGFWLGGLIYERWFGPRWFPNRYRRK